MFITRPSPFTHTYIYINMWWKRRNVHSMRYSVVNEVLIGEPRCEWEYLEKERGDHHHHHPANHTVISSFTMHNSDVQCLYGLLHGLAVYRSRVSSLHLIFQFAWKSVCVCVCAISVQRNLTCRMCHKCRAQRRETRRRWSPGWATKKIFWTDNNNNKNLQLMTWCGLSMVMIMIGRYRLIFVASFSSAVSLCYIWIVFLWYMT